MAFPRHVDRGLNGLAYLIYGLVTGRLRRMLLPIRPREVIATIRDALRFHLSHDDLTVYNGVQKLLYVGIILIAIVEVLAGLAIWKPVQFSTLAALFYSFQGARLVHFFGMAAIVAFLVVHVALALMVPRTLLNMITGGPRVAKALPVPPSSHPNPENDHAHSPARRLAVPSRRSDRSKPARREQGADRADRSPQGAARLAQPRRPDAPGRLRRDRYRLHAEGAHGGLGLERPRPGLSVRSEQAGADLHRGAGAQAAALQRLLSASNTSARSTWPNGSSSSAASYPTSGR